MLDSNFGVVDSLVVAGTLLFSLSIGLWYACKGNQTNEELLMGGRNLSVLPVACSILVTYLSAVTVMGFPAEVYAHGSQIYMMPIAGAIATPIGTYLFAYAFYPMGITSIFQYLEWRFETVLVRRFASLTYMCQVVVATGVILYAPSIALKAILDVPVWLSIVGIGVCATVYTAVGGIKAVVWTDAFQFLMILIGMMAMLIKGIRNAGGFYEALEIADQNGRLRLIDLTVNPFERHNTVNFLFGWGFYTLFIYGTHPPQVQRYCSLPTFRLAVRSISLSIALSLVTHALMIATGIAIFSSYAGCDPVLRGHIKKADQIVPYFVISELRSIPGMTGLFVACIFSAVLSTLSSILNSLSAVVWEDFLARIPIFEQMTERQQVTTSKLMAVFFGILIMFAAFVAQHLGSILQAATSAVGAAMGPLGAVFLIGLFLPWVNKWGAFFGMLSALISMVYIAISAFRLDKTYFIPLPTSVDECPSGTNLTYALQRTPKAVEEFDWPEKLFTLSYLLYPFVGAWITIIMSLIISALTGGFRGAHRVKRKYLHPLLRKRFGSNYDRDLIVTPEDAWHANQAKVLHDLVKGSIQNEKGSLLVEYRYENIPLRQLH